MALCKDRIKREGIDKLLDWLEKSDFYQAPASTKYHGNYEGGLCEHSLNVLHCLNSVLSEYPEIEVSIETKAIIALFHDLCKTDFYITETKSRKTGEFYPSGKPIWEDYTGYAIDEKFPVGHGEKSIIMLQNFMKLTKEEIISIRWHMGSFDNAVKGGDYGMTNAYEKCPLAVALHLADMAATYLIEERGKTKEVDNN